MELPLLNINACLTRTLTKIGGEDVKKVRFVPQGCIHKREADFHMPALRHQVTLIPSERLALELRGMPSLLCLPSM